MIKPVKIPFDAPLIEAVFLERPNRFVAVVQLPGEKEPVRAHVPDPGRLKELLLPNARILVQDHGDNTHRKLRYTLQMVYSQEGHLVCLNTQMPNRWFGQLIEADVLPFLEGYETKKREYTYKHDALDHQSRIDFLLSHPAKTKNCLVEIKAVSLVEGKRALFPDAPTVRGVKHMKALIHAKSNGYDARIVFMVQRGDPEVFSPNRRTDPDLANTLKDAILAGVDVNIICLSMTPTYCELVKEIPLELSAI